MTHRTTAFEPGLLGRRCWLELATGERINLPIQRWRAPSGAGDELLLRCCTGPTLDIGCGPGRLTAALVNRGVVALGVDISPVAVRLTRARGAPAIRRDVFARLPGEGRWHHALLADGNIGIGGNPTRLLRRLRELLAPGGTALVELDPPGHGLRRDRVRVNGADHWFAWAWLGADAIADTAREAGMVVHWLAERGGRWFAELVKP
ncbi:MAG TPA: class I SAM-dependent methyltransferase [Actinophytocola sp.]|uniref:class I SAM-dependent methyltransferase n=1 Tax=Actinophytocola sp. TaxID=1872138 RepID=UPI002DBCEC43|nr:class I SAM-dependent methyltransferase [Actinophytocola sp.]HEU5475994.1 class I SAM-dependent methyltransferase [Actinophytocola sp.]